MTALALEIDRFFQLDVSCETDANASRLPYTRL